VWTVHGDRPLRIERSKLATLAAYDPRWHTTLVDVSRMNAKTESQLFEALAITIDSASARLNRLPAGDYDLRLMPRMERAATVALSVGRNDPPFEALHLEPSSSSRLRVPVSLLTLMLVTKDDVGSAGPWLSVTPVSVNTDAIRLKATHATHYGRTRAFFFDERAYPERDGFWTRANSNATVVVDTEDGVRLSGLPISITAGAVPTTVDLSTGGWRESFSLNAGQTQELTLPKSETGAWTLSMRSGAGFRPSERDPASRDVRLLGAWIAIH
jgi:hypothetical protein